MQFQFTASRDSKSFHSIQVFKALKRNQWTLETLKLFFAWESLSLCGRIYCFRLATSCLSMRHKQQFQSQQHQQCKLWSVDKIRELGRVRRRPVIEFLCKSFAGETSIGKEIQSRSVFRYLLTGVMKRLSWLYWFCGNTYRWTSWFVFKLKTNIFGGQSCADVERPIFPVSMIHKRSHSSIWKFENVDGLIAQLE